MKMVKSLLLGSAAGLVAVTAGQAADLPVKAKPVEYVKVCSLYGAGFYYMPGTELCLKVGGWARAEALWGANGSTTTTFVGDANQRSTNNLVWRARGYITVDAREQTAYGTARGYLAVGISTTDVGLNTAGNQFSANRAFVQFAGITAGITQSFYDYYSQPAASLFGAPPASDTGDPGWQVFAYTAQLGNGLSATISAEARRMTQIINQNNAAASVYPGSSVGVGSGGTIVPGGYFDTLTGTTAGSTTAVNGGGSLFPGTGAYGGNQTPDIVGNIRLDQAWGGAQIMGALHEVNATYYSSGDAALSQLGPNLNGGHPGDAWGWAAGAGLRINTPFITQGDYFQGQVNATEGALRYLFFSPNGNFGVLHGNTEAYGVLSDAVYGGSASGHSEASLQLTSAWGFNASYEHFWAPNWKQSVYGGYSQVTYNSQANAMLCTAAGFGSGVGSNARANAGCDNNWSVWFVGSRLQWNVTSTFYMGVDLLYENLKSATTGSTASGTVSQLGGYQYGSALVQASNNDNWTVRFRIHKDFLP